MNRKVLSLMPMQLVIFMFQGKTPLVTKLVVGTIMHRIQEA